MLSIIERYGLRAVRPSLRGCVDDIWQQNSLITSLQIHRKPMLQLERPSNAQSEYSGFSSLMEAATRVPGMLAQVDQMVARTRGERSAPTPEAVMAVLTKLSNAIAFFKKWQLEEASQLPYRHRLTSIDGPELSHFPPLIAGSLKLLKFAYVFLQNRYEPPLRGSALCILKCQQAIVQIHRELQDMFYTEYSEAEQGALQLHACVTEAEALGTVEMLCMLVPWSCVPQGMNVGCVNAFSLLHEAIEHYQSRGQDMERRLQWCRTVWEALARKYGMRIYFQS